MGCDFVLIVEDDPMIRETIAELVGEEGYPVMTAANGREALAILRACGGRGLILLDLMMPEMNGWEFLEARSREDGMAGLPVVILSASHYVAPPPVDGILSKPVRLEHLLGTVRSLCGPPVELELEHEGEQPALQ